jgi:hypothetical protein
MIVTVLKIFAIYFLFLLVKNSFRGLLTYRHLKREARTYANPPKGDVFDAEFRRID